MPKNNSFWHILADVHASTMGIRASHGFATIEMEIEMAINGCDRICKVTGRHHQLRQHCVDLGLPIVNEERSLFEAAAGAWQGRTGAPLPCYHVRGGGNLFLQAVALSFEGRRVEVPLSSRFDRLLKTSSRAFEEGWRSKADGSTFREPA